jgi:ArsR family transcriptional regulator
MARMTDDAEAHQHLVDYVEVFKALGDPTRLEMLRLMVTHSEAACHQFEQEFQLSKPLISYHVRILRNARLIQIRKEGRFYHYSLRREVWEHSLPGLVPIIEGYRGVSVPR